MPLLADLSGNIKKTAWLEKRLNRLLTRAYKKQIDDALIAKLLSDFLEAHQLAAEAVLSVLQGEVEEEEDGSVDYFG